MYQGYDELPGVIIEVPVTYGQYGAICGMIESFLLDSHLYSYNTFGLFRLRGECDTRFFCSEFVYHVLNENGVCDLGVDRIDVRPQMLLEIGGRIVFDGNLLLLRGGYRSSPPLRRRFLHL
jgi:hypothetical protein